MIVNVYYCKWATSRELSSSACFNFFTDFEERMKELREEVSF